MVVLKLEYYLPRRISLDRRKYAPEIGSQTSAPFYYCGLGILEGFLNEFHGCEKWSRSFLLNLT